MQAVTQELKGIDANSAAKTISKVAHSATLNRIKAEFVSGVLERYEEVLDRPLVLKPEDFKNGRIAFEDQASIPDLIMENINSEIVTFCVSFNPILKFQHSCGLKPNLEKIDFDFLKTMIRYDKVTRQTERERTLGDLVDRKEWISPYSTKHPNNQGYTLGPPISDTYLASSTVYFVADMGSSSIESSMGMGMSDGGGGGM